MRLGLSGRLLELEWKTLIFFERAVPISPNASYITLGAASPIIITPPYAGGLQPAGPCSPGVRAAAAAANESAAAAFPKFAAEARAFPGLAPPQVQRVTRAVTHTERHTLSRRRR